MAQAFHWQGEGPSAQRNAPISLEVNGESVYTSTGFLEGRNDVMWNRKRIGISVGAGQMALAVVRRRGTLIAVEKTVTEVLAAGLCRPSPVEKNITDPARWQGHVGALLGRFPKIRSATLSLPDTAVRTLLMTLQQVPESRADFEKLIQWHMEKTFLHPLGEARFSHQILSRDATGTRLLATAVKQEVAQQYEAFNGAGAGAGIEIDRVGPSSLFVCNLFRPAVDRLGARHFLFVRIFDQTLTLIVFESGLPTFIRTKDFPESEAWDEMLIAELTTSLSFYEGSGHTITALTHLLVSAGAEYAPTARLRESIRLTVVHLDPRSVFQSESVAPAVVAAVAAAAA